MASARTCGSDGSRLWLDARVRLLRQPDGTTAGVVGIAEDITARKDAEAAARIALDTSRQTEERRRGAVMPPAPRTRAAEPKTRSSGTTASSS